MPQLFVIDSLLSVYLCVLIVIALPILSQIPQLADMSVPFDPFDYKAVADRPGPLAHGPGLLAGHRVALWPQSKGVQARRISIRVADVRYRPAEREHLHSTVLSVPGPSSHG